jgi:hypothetical protein
MRYERVPEEWVDKRCTCRDKDGLSCLGCPLHHFYEGDDLDDGPCPFEDRKAWVWFLEHEGRVPPASGMQGEK